MKNVRCAIAGMTLLCIPYAVKAQSALDRRNINQANNVLNTSYNCADAARYLRLVSDAGKKTDPYKLAMARTADCNADSKEALKLYNEYLKHHPTDDSVKKRVAELNHSVPESAETRKKVQEAKQFYKTTKKGGYNKCFYENGFRWGLVYDQMLSKDNFLYSRAYSLENVYEYPFAKDKLLFETVADIGLLGGGSKEWTAKVLDVAPTSVEKVRGAAQFNFGLGMNYIFVNTVKKALTGGIYGGYNMFLVNDPDIGNYESGSFSAPTIGSFTAGLRSTLCLGEHFYITLSYIKYFRNSYTNDSWYGTTETPVNGDRIRLSIGLRGMGTPNVSYHTR